MLWNVTTSGDVPEGMDMPFGMSGMSFGRINTSQGGDTSWGWEHGWGCVPGWWTLVRGPDDVSGWWDMTHGTYR